MIGRFNELLGAALEEGVDLVIQGAGFRLDTFEMAKKYDTPVFSIEFRVIGSRRGLFLLTVWNCITFLVLWMRPAPGNLIVPFLPLPELNRPCRPSAIQIGRFQRA